MCRFNSRGERRHKALGWEMHMRPALPLLLLLSLTPPPAWSQSAQDLRERGIEAFQRGDAEVAVREFRQLVEQQASGENFSYLATAEFVAGDLPRAIEHFQRAIRLGYDTGSVHYNLGLAYQKLEQREAGIRELKAAAEREPGSMQVKYALGLALLEAGRPHAALPYLGEASASAPRDGAMAANLVRARFEAGQATEALRAVDQAIRTNREDPVAAATLGRICLEHGQAQEARHLLENASEALPQDTGIKFLLARVSLAAGEPGEVLYALKGVDANAGAPGERDFLLSRALALADRLPEAAAEIAAAVRADPKNVDYLLTSAWIAQLEDEYDRSIATLSEARKLDPARASVPYRMAVTYFLMMRYRDAAAQCEEALLLAPRSDPAYFLLGIAKLDDHDFAGAQAALRRAVELNGRAPLYRYQLGITLSKVGQIPEAVR